MTIISIPDQDTVYEADISVRRGDTFTQDFAMAGYDYTLYSFRCQVRDILDGRLIMNITPTFVSYDDEETVSVINISKSATQTVVRPGRYEYDIAFIHPDGSPDIDRIKGLFIVYPDVTINIPNLLEDDDGGNIDVG